MEPAVLQFTVTGAIIGLAYVVGFVVGYKVRNDK